MVLTSWQCCCCSPSLRWFSTHHPWHCLWRFLGSSDIQSDTHSSWCPKNYIVIKICDKAIINHIWKQIIKQSCLNKPFPFIVFRKSTNLHRDVVPGRGEGHVVAEAGGPLQQLPPLAAPRHHLNLVLLVDHHPAPHSLYQTCQRCLTKLTRKLLLWLSQTVDKSTIPWEKLLLQTLSF